MSIWASVTAAFFAVELATPTRAAWEQPHNALRVADALLEFGRSKYNLLVGWSLGPVTDYADNRNGDEGSDAFAGPFILETAVGLFRFG